jgi:hypothetical protein
MTNNLIKYNIQLDSTNLIRRGTGYPYAPFELKLQLHGQVSNPYTVSVKQNYKASTIINVDVPAYTEKSWTTPGTYTWTVPAGVTKVKAEVAGAGGGGGGGCQKQDNDGVWNTTGRAGKGGNGELLNEYISVTPSENISIIVGAGGSGGHYTRVGVTVGSAGSSGGASICKNITARGGGGGSRAVMSPSYTDGVSYGNGGNGGTAGSGRSNGGSGANGWVKIAYGQGIE